MSVIHKIIIDFAKKQYVEVEVTQKSDVILEIYLMNQGKQMTSDQIKYLTVKAVTSDANEVYKEIEFADNHAVYEVSDNIRNSSGKTVCVLQAVDEDLKIMESFEFYITTQESLFDENKYVGEDDITAVMHYVNCAEEAAKDSEKIKNEIVSTMDDFKAMSGEMQAGIEHVEKMKEMLEDQIGEIEDDLEKGKYIGAQGIQGPRGQQGKPGEKGEAGEKGEPGTPGESGVTAPTSGFFTLSMDPEGNVYVHYPDSENMPEFEVTDEGDIYLLLDEKICIGNVKGPQGEPGGKFVAEIYKTSFDEVEAAYQAGKMIYVRYIDGDNDEFEIPLNSRLEGQPETTYIFNYNLYGFQIMIYLFSENGWQEDEFRYITNSDIANEQTEGVVKIKNQGGIKNGSAGIYLDSPNDDELKNKLEVDKALKPNMIDKIVKHGLVNNQLDWTDEERIAVATLLGKQDAVQDTLVTRGINGNIKVPLFPRWYDNAASMQYVISSLRNFEQLELINSVEISEEITEFSINRDMDGNEFWLKKAILFYYYPKYTGNSDIPAYCFSEVNGVYQGDTHERPAMYTNAFGMPKRDTARSGYWIIDLIDYWGNFNIRYEKKNIVNTNRADLYGLDNGNYICEAYQLNNEMGEIGSIGFKGGLAYEGCKFILYGVII